MAHAIDTLTRALRGAGALDDDAQAALGHLAACEGALKSIAMLMAGPPEWSADTLEDISDRIADIAPHPGGVLEGRDESGAGPAERYLHEMGEHGFAVCMGDIVEAQSIDDEHTPREDDEDG